MPTCVAESGATVIKADPRDPAAQRQAKTPIARIRQALGGKGTPRDGWLAAACVIVVCAISVGVRWALMTRLPMLLTNDSIDYLVAAERIASNLDFFNPGLRDWRLPGYPVLLAIVNRLAGAGLAPIEGTQAALGAGSVLVALALGRIAGLGWGGTAVLGLFVGLHPILLLLEHTVMSETTLTLLLLASSAALCAVLTSRRSDLSYLLTGLLLGVTLLTRSNATFFLLGLLLTLTAIAVKRSPTAEQLRPVRSLLTVAAGTLLVLTPWVARNQIHLGKPSPFAGNTHRALLLYHAQHGLLDPELPLMARHDWQVNDLNTSAYRLLEELGAQDDSEREARNLLVEQMAAHPAAYARQVLWSAIHWTGLPAPLAAYGRQDLQFWTNQFMADLPALAQHNRRLLRELSSYDQPIDPGREGRGLRAWRAASLHLFAWGRPLLFASSVLAFCVLVRRFVARHSDNHVAGRATTIGIAIGVAQFGNVGAHAILLADYDRFAVPYDPFALLVVCLAIASTRESPTRPSGEPTCATPSTAK